MNSAEEDILQTLFRLSDIDKSKGISGAEFNKLFSLVDLDLTQEEIIKRYDLNGDKSISFDEFKRLFNAHELAAYRATPQDAAGARRYLPLMGALAQTKEIPRGTKFNDPFSVHANLADNHKGDASIVWKRITEISSDAKVFVHQEGHDSKADTTDASQGGLGNCWFVAAISIAASASDKYYAIQNLFMRSNLEEGRLHIRFYHDFKWVVVEIDDKLPCRAKGGLFEPIYARDKNGTNEFWAPLLEKAYAKLHNGYQEIVGGQPIEGVRDLTGSGAHRIDLPYDGTLYPIKLNKDFPVISRLQFNHRNAFLTTGIVWVNKGELVPVPKNPQEIVQAGTGGKHALCVLDCKEYKGEVVLRVRNPWGRNGEWKGKWSDSSNAWTPEAKQALGYENKNDGIFFMPALSYREMFISIDTALLRQGSGWKKWRFVSKFQAGKSGNTSRSVFNYLIRCDTTNDVIVCLSQKSQRYLERKEKYMQMWVKVAGPNNFKKAPAARPRRDISCEFIIPANLDGNFTITPRAKGVHNAEFELNIYARLPAIVSVQKKVK